MVRDMGIVPVVAAMVWTWWWVWASAVAAADYGGPPPKPAVVIKPAGPSRQYGWVGNGYYAPLHVPKPIVIPKWVPHMDPTYTAFWVAQAPSKGGPKGGHKQSHASGFGPPKGTSIVRPSSHGHDSKGSPSHRAAPSVAAPPQGPAKLPPVTSAAPVGTSPPAPLGDPINTAAPPSAPIVPAENAIKTAAVALNSLATGESSYSQL